MMNFQPHTFWALAKGHEFRFRESSHKAMSGPLADQYQMNGLMRLWPFLRHFVSHDYGVRMFIRPMCCTSFSLLSWCGVNAALMPRLNTPWLSKVLELQAALYDCFTQVTYRPLNATMNVSFGSLWRDLHSYPYAQIPTIRTSPENRSTGGC